MICTAPGNPFVTCLYLSVSCFLITGAIPVQADLTDLKVYSPIVEKDEKEVEFLGNVRIDDDPEHDGARHHEFEVSYGFTDYWSSSLTFSLVKPASELLKLDIVGWENTFQFTPEGKYWLDLGLHLELEIDDEGDEPNNIEGRFLFRKSLAEFEHVLNLNIEQGWGSSADESTELEYIWRTIYSINDTVGTGFEAFGTIGEIKYPDKLSEQEHILGPALYLDFDMGAVELNSKLVWLFGLTEGSADHTFHWRVAFEF